MNNKTALLELKSILFKEFPNYAKKLILFGSQADGTARDYSDYDVLFIVKKKYDWRFENEIYNACFEINLKYDIITDIKIISGEELQTIKGKQPFIQNALNYGVTI